MANRINSGLACAIRFLFPFGGRSSSVSRPFSPSAVTWVVPIGLLIGLAWLATFRISWRVFGEVAGIRVVPPLAVLVLELLFTGPFLAIGLARTVQLLVNPPREAPLDSTASRPEIGTLILILTVLSQWVLITSIPLVSVWWPPLEDWRHNFRFMYPAPIYRALILAPMWGRWGILAAACVGGPASARAPLTEIESETAQWCRSVSPLRLLRSALLPTILTVIYCARDGRLHVGLIVSLLTFGITYLGAMAMALRGRGQTRDSLFASGQIAQLAFLALYRAFWPLIHGWSPSQG